MKLCIDISKLNILRTRKMDTMNSRAANFINMMSDGKTRFAILCTCGDSKTTCDYMDKCRCI